MKIFRHSLALLFVLSCCTKTKRGEPGPGNSIEQHLSLLTQQHAQAEIHDSLGGFMGVYANDAISMPEYQLTLDGQKEIDAYYAEIFQRLDVKSYELDSEEFVHLDSATVVEIGTFDKKFSRTGEDSITTLRGKYWHVWRVDQHGGAKLEGEAFGYFHPVERPTDLVVRVNTRQPNEWDIYEQKEIPFELKAYNALMEKGVRRRDAVLRSNFFTNDARFFPFADTTVTGMDQIKPYLTAYSSRGKVTIDSIQCYTYHFKRAKNYMLEYPMFKVRWSTEDFSGGTEGKGIRIWKRQQDGSLRLYREIGTHNHIE